MEHVEGWDFVFGRLVVGFEGGGRTERGEERKRKEGRRQVEQGPRWETDKREATYDEKVSNPI